jgi:carbon storage regulator CsrA
MLVLTRKQQESLLIGDNIKVSIVRVRGNSIQLGIEAPKSVRVMRSELLDREQASSLKESPAGSCRSAGTGDDRPGELSASDLASQPTTCQGTALVAADLTAIF